MTEGPKQLDTADRRRAGHYESLGETYAKFEFFENGWNPYSHYLDVDKVDLILRRRVGGTRIYREIQVKYGKLYDVGAAWEKALFAVTSWRFFKEVEFAAYADQPDLFVAYVLSHDVGYDRDIFIFPVRDFIGIVKAAIPLASDGKRGQRKMYLSRLKGTADKWYLRRESRFDAVTEKTCLDISGYRRAFHLLAP